MKCERIFCGLAFFPEPDFLIWRRLFAVVADRLNRATFHGFDALFYFLFGLGLLEDVGIPFIIRTLVVKRGGFAAEITIDALGIDVIFASYILRIFVFEISHGGRAKKIAQRGPRCKLFFPALSRFAR
jgi:hypothetical protein